MIPSSLIIIEFPACDRIGVQNDMVVQMGLVAMGSDHNLTVLAEGLFHECFCNTVCSFRSDVLIRRKGLDIVNCLDSALAVFRDRLIKMLSAELLIDKLHVQICFLRIGNAVE